MKSRMFFRFVLERFPVIDYLLVDNVNFPLVIQVLCRLDFTIFLGRSFGKERANPRYLLQMTVG